MNLKNSNDILTFIIYFDCMEIGRSDITITGLRLDSRLSKFKGVCI